MLVVVDFGVKLAYLPEASRTIDVCGLMLACPAPPDASFVHGNLAYKGLGALYCVFGDGVILGLGTP